MEKFDFSELHVRPRFRFTANHAPELIETALRERLKTAKPKLPYNISNRYVNIDVPVHLAHFWSPRISFEIESLENEANKSMIRGLIGPKPQVWTMFVFLYFGLGVLGLFASIYGLSKYSLDSYSHFVWGFPIALVLMSTAYLSSQSGEKLGAEQIHLLKSFLAETFDSLDEKS